MSLAAISIAGLVLTLVGAWLVAIELVIRFRGYAYQVKGVTFDGTTGEVGKTPEFERWELTRATLMWLGLVCITAGTLLQIYVAAVDV